MSQLTCFSRVNVNRICKQKEEGISCEIWSRGRGGLTRGFDEGVWLIKLCTIMSLLKLWCGIMVKMIPIICIVSYSNSCHFRTRVMFELIMFDHFPQLFQKILSLWNTVSISRWLYLNGPMTSECVWFRSRKWFGSSILVHWLPSGIGDLILVPYFCMTNPPVKIIYTLRWILAKWIQVSDFVGNIVGSVASDSYWIWSGVAS